MASIGSGYDLSVSTFSPDGKVFQVEYACKAVENAALSIAAVFNDGVVLAAEKWITSPLVLKSSRSRCFKIAPHVCAVVTGNLPDGKNLIQRCREECSEYEKIWGVPITGAVLADRLGLYVHSHTAVWSTRPVGASLMVAVHEKHERKGFTAARKAMDANTKVPTYINESTTVNRTQWSLWLIDPTGAAYKYRGNCQGKGAAGAKTDLERLNLESLNVQQGCEEFAKILVKQHEDNSREKTMVMEMMILKNDWPYALHESEIEVAHAEATQWLNTFEA